jgi:hypothetical protein
MTQFEKLVNYFERSPVHSICRRTDIGVFVPSELRILKAVFDFLAERGKIQRSDQFLDAGSGDGRVVLLGSLYCSHATGVEWDLDLLIASFFNSNRLGYGDVSFFQGDFCEDVTYERRNFADFTVIFNFLNDERRLAEKIVTESRPGTRFILYAGIVATPEPYTLHVEGWQLEETLIVEGGEHARRVLVYQK